MLQQAGRIGIIITLCLVFQTGATQSSQQQFKITNWSPEVKLPIYTNQSMIKDSLGFLWFTSTDGLWRFDGSSFQGYHSTSRKNSIIGEATRGLVEDSLHNIWIGSDSGLNRYDIRADSFQTFYLIKKNISGTNYFIPFHATKNEVWYIDRNEGILAINIYSGEKRILFNKVPIVFYSQNLIQTFYDNASQSIWFPGGDAFFRFSMKDGKTYTSLPGEKGNSLAGLKRVLAIVNDTARHCVWFAAHDLQLDLLGSAGKEINYLKSFSNIVASRINALALDKKNRLWIGTRSRGIFIYDPENGSFQHLTRETGSPNTLQSNLVRNIYCDREGMIWAGTGTGFDQLSNNVAIQHYTDFTENGNDLSSGNVRTLAEARGGKIWIGGWDGPIDIFDPVTKSFEPLSKKDFPDIPIDRIRLIRIDTITNKAWIGADFRPGELDLTTKKYEPIIFKDVKGKIVDPLSVLSQHWEALNDSVWLMGTWYGLFTYKKGSGVAHQLPFLVNKNIQYIGKGKNIFFFNSLDLFPVAYKYSNGKWDSLGKLFGKIPVRHCILWDTLSESWWVGAATGLYNINKDFKIIRHYTTEDGLPDNTVNSIIIDKNGLLWLGTFKGLCTFDPQKGYFNYVGAAYDRKEIYYPRSFLLASNGDIYMGGGDGLDRIQPDRVIHQFLPAEIYFKSLSIDKKDLANSININRTEKLSLKYFQNSLNIEIGVLDFYSRGSNRIRYKLSGLTDDWQYSKGDQQIRYGGLTPGTYVFIMQATNANNEWNGHVKRIKFIISPPFWGTWWFLTLCALLAAIIVYSFYRYRINQLEKLFAIRTKISQNLHDEIGSTLTSINILSKVSLNNLEKDTVKSGQLLKKITEQSDIIQQSMSDIVWTIHPENDKLENIVIRMREYLGHTAEAKEFEVEFYIDEKISKENLAMQQRQNVFLVFKEAVNNAVKYSLGKKVIVSLLKENHQIKLSIEDNGMGFDTYAVRSSSGLKNMRERAKELKGELKIHTMPGRGTKVELLYPAT